MVNWDNILNIFKFNENSPLLFTSGSFLLIFILFYLLFIPLKNNKRVKIVYLTIFSLYFYYKTSGIYILVLLFISLSDYIIANKIYQEFNWTRRKLLLLLSLIIDIGVLCYFKYTNFIVETISDLLNKPFDVDNIILPVGISFFIFQSISYVIDVYQNECNAIKNYIDYLFFLSFFPHILSGPIIRANKFLPQIEKSNYLTKENYNTAFYLITIGLIKKAIIADYIGVNFVDRTLDDPIMYTGFENLIGVYGFTLQIYFDFSGYSDLAIGIALLLGYEFPINFNRPYLSATPTEFWRRWHITLSTWLRDYLYIPLGGNRRGNTRKYLNLFITMVIGGLWHGAAFRFIIWGAWHGLGLCVHKFLTQINSSIKTFSYEMSTTGRFIGTFLTFHFVCLGWILFRVDSVEKASCLLNSIFTSLDFNLIPNIISFYGLQIFVILVGYILIFLPENINQKISLGIKNSSTLSKIMILVIVFWLIIQVKTSEIQSFIYFQF